MLTKKHCNSVVLSSSSVISQNTENLVSLVQEDAMPLFEGDLHSAESLQLQSDPEIKWTEEEEKILSETQELRITSNSGIDRSSSSSSSSSSSLSSFQDSRQEGIGDVSIAPLVVMYDRNRSTAGDVVLSSSENENYKRIKICNRYAAI